MRDLLKKPSVFLTVLYTLAWGPMLFLRGAYWDGWVFFSEFTHKDFAFVYGDFHETSNYHHYYTFRFLELFSDPSFIGRSIVFLSWLVAGLLLYRILRRLFDWNIYAATLTVAYLLIYPVFFVRFEFIHMYYSASVLFFSLGCYLYLTNTHRSRAETFVREMAALPLIILSFFTNSFVFFFFAFLATHLYLFAGRTKLPVMSAVQQWLTRFPYLVALPFVFMYLKTTYLPPIDRYIHYNELIVLHPSLSVLSKLIEGGWGGLWAGFLWPLVYALQLMERKYFAMALLLATTIIVVLFRSSHIAHEAIETPGATKDEPWYLRWYRKNPTRGIIALGAIFLFLGLFPYVAVGKYPHIYGYGFGLRHSLLMPLGSAFLLFGTVAHLVRDRYQMLVHGVLISLSVAFLWFNFFLLDVDWYKQQAIMAKLPATISTIKGPAVLVFSDETPGYNWLHRRLSLQDYRGFLRMVTGTWEYDGIDAIDFPNGSTELLPDPRTIESIRIVSDRHWDEPLVPEWAHLKWIELRYGQERLRAEAARIMQISLIDAGPITKDPKKKTVPDSLISLD